MKKFVLQAIAVSMLAGQGLAQDIYTVKYGDILSGIVKNRYPAERIYGSKGKLAEIIKLNPHLINPNLIFPRDKIHFISNVEINKTEESLESVEAEATPEREQPERKVSELKASEEWNVSALYGAKFLSISQSGVLGEAEVGVLFLDNLKVNSDFIFNDWSFGFQIDSYTFKYKALSSGNSQKMYGVNFYGSKGWLLAGLNIEQNPLLSNTNGNVEISRMTMMSLSLGAKKDFELPTRKPTTLKLKGWGHYPFSSSSDHADIKLKSLEGFGVHGQIELNRQIFAKNEYSLHGTWMNQAGILKTKQNVEWDNANGQVKSNIINISTTLGFLLKF
jgi:hypothetical protein